MCEAMKTHCGDCPMYDFCVAYDGAADITDEQIADVAKWVEANPPKTRLDKLREIFPKAPADICPYHLDTNFHCPGSRSNCYKCQSEYWNAEAE